MNSGDSTLTRCVPIPDTASAVLVNAPVGKHCAGIGFNDLRHASTDRKPTLEQDPTPMASTAAASV